MEGKEQQKDLTLYNVIEHFRAFNKENGIHYGDTKAKEITAIIVYKQSNFTLPYSEAARSYRISNLCGKVFFDTPSGSRSMVGTCLDGSDPHVRLDYYNWFVERCYLENSAEVKA